jgi:3-(3-hydroxy-phenyl)propionate hydroxylase
METDKVETFRFAPLYELPAYAFVPPPELKALEVRRHPIVIVGAGPAGLTLACDLARRGIPSVVLDEDDTVGVRGASSRGICYAQKSLEIFDRLGIVNRILEKGVTWSLGRTFSEDCEVYSFNLENECISAQPPFVNLQQFYIEWFLVDRIQELGFADLRWKNRVTDVRQEADFVSVSVETPEGSYKIQAEYLIDATGANSSIRSQLGVPGQMSRSTDRWCITDVKFKKPFPIERWTWVDASFNEGRGVWQHLMADNVWRIDYQMPEDADPEYISRPEVAGSRLREQLGPDIEFEFVWIGAYQYRDFLLDEFRHGRVFFIGDSAHVVSPFGARGGNTGIQDAANLAWKLALLVQGQCSPALLDSFNAERRAAALENLAVTSRSARFLAPRSTAEHTLRRSVLDLAKKYEFARALVNTGRMSVANNYPPGPCLPQGSRSIQNVSLKWSDGRATRLTQLQQDGTRFLALWFEPDNTQYEQVARALAGLPVDLMPVGGELDTPTLIDETARLAQHIGRAPGRLCLIRPDGYVSSTIEHPDLNAVVHAVRTALGQN